MGKIRYAAGRRRYLEKKKRRKEDLKWIIHCPINVLLK